MTHSSRLAVAASLVLALAHPAMAQTSKPKPKPKPKAPPAAVAPAPRVPEPPPLPPSVTVTTKYTVGTEAIVTTLHSSGARQRFDFANGRTLIVQCDTGKAIQISDLAKSYTSGELADASAAAPREKAKGGPVTFKTTITDTGERRDLFGVEARRVKTVTTREPSPAACGKSRTRSETDGWYADLPVAMQCAGAPPAAPADAKEDCADQVILETSGPASALGYPLAYTTTTTDEGGKVLSTISMEATALTKQPVDAPKYDVPPGYAAVKDAGELARAELAAKGIQPKGLNVIRIGIVLPRNTSGTEVAPDAIRNELIDTLAVHPYEPLALDATDPAAVNAEAAQKECDYILHTDLVTAKTSTPGRVGGLMNRVTKSDVKENHEAKVQYRLQALTGSKTAIDKSASAKSGAGMNVRTVLGVARLAARLYFGLSGGVMRAMMSNAGGGAAAADPMTNALDMVLNLGAPKEPPANTLEGIIITALRTQSADVIKAIGR